MTTPTQPNGFSTDSPGSNTTFSGPGPSFSGPGPSFSGPGPSFSGPGPSYSGPGPSFSGPGPSFSGPGPSHMKQTSQEPMNFHGPGFNNIERNNESSPQPIQMATKFGDKDIIHRGPPCAKCGDMIIGQILNAIGRTYHPEHFVCACCSQPFDQGKFIIHEGEPYCHVDYYELFSNKCKTCNEPIKDKFITVEDYHFHPEHFVCETCGKLLPGMKYKVHEKTKCILCVDCYVKRIQLSDVERYCAKCKRLIEGEYIILKGQFFHAEHFRCEECGCAFSGGNSHEFEGALYCTEHYEQMLRKNCAKCKKPILGRSITAAGRMWHPEHFCCHVCSEMLNGTSYYEKGGEPYCELHYSQLFGVTCSYCEMPILKNGKKFLDKQFHVEHFLCSVCENPLKDGAIQEWDSKPYCTKCYMKLPSELRKKYEKKKNEELKFEKRKILLDKREEKKKLKEEKKEKKDKTKKKEKA